MAPDVGAAPTPGKRRILLAALLSTFAFAVLAGSAEAASSLYVSTRGSDRSACTRLKPCRTFDRAYRLARPGQTVLLRPGVYRSQVIRLDRRKKSLRDVVFRPVTGARVVVVGRLDVRARHLELRRLRVSGWRALSTASDLTFRSVATGYFRIHGANGVRVLGGSVGPSTDVPSLVTASGTRAARSVTVDGTTIHGYHASAQGSRLSCLTVTGVSGLTIRKSHLYDCEFAGLLFEKGGAASPTNVTVENSEIECCRSGSYAVYLDDQSGASWRGFLVRHNSTNAAFGIDPASTTLADLRFYSNIATSFTGCARTGVTADYNVWENGTECGTADVVAPSGFVDQEEQNFELLPGAAAIDLGAPPGYPTSDITGETRPLGGAPDAGARESRATGLVAAYGFNDPVGLSIRDASGLGNNGLAAGASPTTVTIWFAISRV